MSPQNLHFTDRLHAAFSILSSPLLGRCEGAIEHRKRRWLRQERSLKKSRICWLRASYNQYGKTRQYHSHVIYEQMKHSERSATNRNRAGQRGNRTLFSLYFEADKMCLKANKKPHPNSIKTKEEGL